MKKLILYLIVLLSLVGCSQRGWKIEMAVDKCKEHGGVDTYTTIWLTTTVICSDSTSTFIKLKEQK